MSFILKLALVFFLAYVESTMILLPLTILLLVVLLLLNEQPTQEGEVFLLAIAGGVLLDVLQVRHLGTTSAFLLTILFLLSLYKRKIIGRNPLFVGLAVFLSSFLFSFLSYREAMLAFSQASLLIFLVLVSAVFLKLPVVSRSEKPLLK